MLEMYVPKHKDEKCGLVSIETGDVRASSAEFMCRPRQKGFSGSNSEKA